MNEKGKFNFGIRYIHLGLHLFLWRNLCNWCAARSQNISMRFESARDVLFIPVWQRFSPLEKENRIRDGKSTGFTPPLRDFTHVHVHAHKHTRIQTHTHTTFSTRIFRIYVAFQRARKTVGLLSHKCFIYTRTFPHVTTARVFKNSRLQTRSCYSYRLSQRTRIAEISDECAEEISEGVCQVVALLRMSLYRLVHFYGIFDTLRCHACVPTYRKTYIAEVICAIEPDIFVAG